MSELRFSAEMGLNSVGFGGRRYHFITGLKDYSKDVCQRNGFVTSNLVEIESREEESFLKRILSEYRWSLGDPNLEFFIGIADSLDRWTSNKPLDHLNWCLGTPAGAGPVVLSPDHCWKEASDSKAGVICEERAESRLSEARFVPSEYDGKCYYFSRSPIIPMEISDRFGELNRAEQICGDIGASLVNIVDEAESKAVFDMASTQFSLSSFKLNTNEK